MSTNANAVLSLQQLENEALEDALPQYQQSAAAGSALSAQRVTTIQQQLANAGVSQVPTIGNPISAPDATQAIAPGDLLGQAAAALAGTGVGTAGPAAVGSASQYNPFSSVGTPAPSSGHNWPSDIVAIVLGIVFIGVGLFMFKTTQTIIEAGGRIGAAVAA